MDYHSLIPPTRPAKRSFTSSGTDADIDSSETATSSSPPRIFKRRKLAKLGKTEREKDLDDGDVRLMDSQSEEASTPDGDEQSITDEVPDSARMDRLVSSSDTEHNEAPSSSSPLRLSAHLSDREFRTQTFNLRGRTTTATAAGPSSRADSFSLLRSGFSISGPYPVQIESSLRTVESSDDTLVGDAFDVGSNTIFGAPPIETYEVPPGMISDTRPYIYQTPTRQGVAVPDGNLQTLTGISPPSPSQFSVADYAGAFNHVEPQVLNVGDTMLVSLGRSRSSDPASAHQGIAIDDSPTTQRQRSSSFRNHHARGLENFNTRPSSRRQLENDENRPVETNAELLWDSDNVEVAVASPSAVRHRLQYAENIALLQRSPRNLTTVRSLNQDFFPSFDSSPTRARSLRTEFPNHSMRNVSENRGNASADQPDRPRSIRTEAPGMANRVPGAWSTLNDITVRGGSYRSPVFRTNSLEVSSSAAYRNSWLQESHAYGFTAVRSREVEDNDKHDIIMESSSPVGSPSMLPCGNALIEEMTGCQLDDEDDSSDVLHEVEDVGTEDYRAPIFRSDGGHQGAPLMFQPYATQLRQDADCATI